MVGLVVASTLAAYVVGYLGARALGFLIHDTTTDYSPGSFANCDHFIRKRSDAVAGLEVAFGPLAQVESKLWRRFRPRWDFSTKPQGGCGER